MCRYLYTKTYTYTKRVGKKAIYKLDFEYVLRLLQQHKSESSLTPKDKKSKDSYDHLLPKKWVIVPNT